MGSIEDTASRMVATRATDRAAGTAYLLVVDWDDETQLFSSMRAVPLPRDGSVVIGRASAEADVVLKHRSVSKRNTALNIVDGVIRVADLGSRNGTYLNGEKVEQSRTVSSGDVIGVADVNVVLHQSAAVTARAILAEAPWKRRLAEEIDRANTYGRSVAMLSLVGVSPSVIAGCGDVLRLIDVVGEGESGQTLVLLPEVAGEQAQTIAQGLVAAARGAGTDVKCGMAICPSDACDSETLMLAARKAARQAKTGEVAGALDAVTTIELGTRKVLVLDPAMNRVYALLERLASSQLSVLINGETGVGKENAAYAVHHASNRKGPFIVQNCGGITETLAESLLFGYEKGAFTGATTAKEGLFEAAAGGTLFLDEIGDLPMPIQVKLLRVLENKTIKRIGENRERPIDVRLVSATHRNLDVEVAEKRFRDDLLFRIAGARVILPPLRDRRCEIPVLAQLFLDDYCKQAGRKLQFTPAAMQVLLTNAWPGNVRELRAKVELAAVLAPDESVEAEDVRQALEALGGAVPAPQPSSPAIVLPSAGPTTFRPIAEELRDLERQRMVEALAATDGTKSKAAVLIGMPMRTFTLKAKQYGL